MSDVREPGEACHILIYDDHGLVHLPDYDPVATVFSETLCRPLFDCERGNHITGVGKRVPLDTQVTCVECLSMERRW